MEPPWTSLSEIEHASLEIEKLNAEKKPDYKKWLHMLIAPGGSLGGARPKANVLDKNNILGLLNFLVNMMRMILVHGKLWLIN